MTKLSETIRLRFEETGWTLSEVAERAGLSVSTVWALRHGTRGKRPHPATLEKLAKGLDLPPERLLELPAAGRGPGGQQHR